MDVVVEIERENAHIDLGTRRYSIRAAELHGLGRVPRGSSLDSTTTTSEKIKSRVSALIRVYGHEVYNTSNTDVRANLRDRNFL